MEILALIPARGGSKGLPHKNIRYLAGKSLIEYTIDVARKSKEIDRIIVSTDNQKIAKISRLAGAETPFIRPTKISDDSSSILDVVKHTLDFLWINESYLPDIIIVLQPTSPLRTTSVIDKSIRILKKTKATSVIAVSKIKSHPYASFQYVKKYLKPLRQDFQKYNQRQQYPPLYFPTGSIYTFWTKTLKKYDSIYGPKIKPMIIPKGLDIDIDDVFDLFFAEMIILHWKNYKKKSLI